MLKHSESGGFITIDERSTVRQEGMLEAYVKVCKNDILNRNQANQLFEIEKATEKMENSGTELQWEEDEETGN